MDYVEKCKNQVDFDDMISNPEFSTTIQKLSNSDPQLIIILNQHVLNMTFNWLCNTVNMDKVHENLVMITMDEESKKQVNLQWPKLKILSWTIPCLKDSFNYGDGKYQLFFVFRSNLARAFLHFGKSFWMIQQDTFWGENMLESKLENDQPNADIIFDRASEGGSNIIAGGYYFARPTCSSQIFFKQLSYDLETIYAPDNAYMTYLCSNKGLINCGLVPFNLITNWIWLYEPERLSDTSKIPILVQFDGDTKLGEKFGKMKSLGFYFVDEKDGKTCNSSAVKLAQKFAENGQKSMDKISNRSYSRIQFGIYTWFIDQFYKFDITRQFIEKIVFPNAHYFMLTL